MVKAVFDDLQEIQDLRFALQLGIQDCERRGLSGKVHRLFAMDKYLASVESDMLEENVVDQKVD